MPSSFDDIINFSLSLEEFSNSQDTYILFIDMCNSTKFKQYCIQNEMPDSIWIFRQLMFLARCSKIIRSYNGIIIKTIGDEVMATFDLATEPYDIIRCVFEIFESFQNIKAYNKGNFEINSKASIDFGECYNGSVFDNNLFDPIGSCVDRCARIANFASAKEIVISKDYYELVQNEINKLGIQVVYKNENIKGFGYEDYYILKN